MSTNSVLHLQPLFTGAAAGAVLLTAMGHLAYSDMANSLGVEFTNNKVNFRDYYLAPTLVGVLVGAVIGCFVLAVLRFPDLDDSRRPLVNVSRGLYGACACGVAGACAPICVILALRLCRWLASDPHLGGGWWFLADLEHFVGHPLVGCFAVCACAGWTTFGLAGAHGFARCLTVIFIACLVFWSAMGVMRLAPSSNRMMDHSFFAPANLLFLVGPPIMKACLVTMNRICTPQPE